MKQEVNFRLVENGKEIESIMCEVRWDENMEPVIDFFDRNTGFTGKSSPAASQGNWYFPDEASQLNIRSLIEAVHQLGNDEDWTERLSWEDGAVDEIDFEWTGEYEGYEGEYKSLMRI